MEEMGQEGSLYVHCTRVYSHYILHMKVWIWFSLMMWNQVLYRLQGGALLSSLPVIAIYLQQSFLTQLHLIRCHVMYMIYEYDFSTSQIRWSGKQVNSLDSEEEFICLRYCFLSKVLYLKCWNKFSRTLTFCSDRFLPAQVIWGEQRCTMLLPTQQPLYVRVTNTTRHSFLFLA